jgi:hypothetical protein
LTTHWFNFEGTFGGGQNRLTPRTAADDELIRSNGPGWRTRCSDAHTSLLKAGDNGSRCHHDTASMTRRDERFEMPRISDLAHLRQMNCSCDFVIQMRLKLSQLLSIQLFDDRSVCSQLLCTSSQFT